MLLFNKPPLYFWCNEFFSDIINYLIDQQTTIQNTTATATKKSHAINKYNNIYYNSSRPMNIYFNFVLLQI